MTGRRAPKPADVALAATFHDPPGALAELLALMLPRLQAAYRHVAVAASPPTSARLVDMLRGSGTWAGTSPRNTRGPLYRTALRGALASDASRIHYLDLDRALHWLKRAPRELAAVLRLAAGHDVLLLGRTQKAHRSHHLPLYATEVVANGLMASHAKLDHPIDLLVPSFVVGRAEAALLCARSHARDAGLYGEWPALLLGLRPEVTYLECRGLDWETPDRDRRGVRRLGLPAWRRRFDNPGEWQLRVDMAREYVRGFMRTATRWPTRVETVHRLPARYA